MNELKTNQTIRSKKMSSSNQEQKKETTANRKRKSTKKGKQEKFPTVFTNKRIISSATTLFHLVLENKNQIIINTHMSAWSQVNDN